MRTYSRKRPVYQVIEGVEGLCRLCLCKAEESVPIFAEDSDMFVNLALRITICVGLEMVREDCLSSIICKPCYEELERYYAFRKKCEVSYQKLKSHLMGVKEREYNKAMAVKIEDQSQVVPVEAAQPQQHILLTINENQEVELVNIANLNAVQLAESQDLNKNGQAKVEETTEIRELSHHHDVQMQDITTTNPTLSTLEIQTTTSDLSLIMSTMLIELGVLRQEESGLVLVDDNLRTVELEGEDDTKIVLRLMEEEETFIIVNETCEEKQSNGSASLSLLKKPVKDSEPSPHKRTTFNGKEAKNKEWNTVCGVCGKRFATRSVLARHARVHSGERPHACRVCARRFAQRAVMLRHELVHKESRPFQCNACPKSFTQRGALAAHARAHAPALALHACALCDKVFLYPSGLSRHMATHQGRVYPCAACARVFRDSSSLRRHAAAHRARVPPEPSPRLAPAPEPVPGPD